MVLGKFNIVTLEMVAILIIINNDNNNQNIKYKPLVNPEYIYLLCIKNRLSTTQQNIGLGSFERCYVKTFGKSKDGKGLRFSE